MSTNTLDHDIHHGPEYYEMLAADRRVRADRVRARVAELDETLAPLRTAMKRRACELDLAATAWEQIAEAHRRVAA